MTRAMTDAVRGLVLAIGAALALIGSTTALAQATAVDPDKAIDADLVKPTAAATPAPAATATIAAQPVEPGFETPATASAAPPPPATAAGTPPSGTYKEDDLIGAAEGVFGKGAAGLADVIKDILSKQGEPNAYIVGREASAAIGVGLRYGSGTLHHKVEGERAAYWTGPSIGFDAGANGGNAFVLVYNLYDTNDLFKRYGAGEGQAYLIGGFHVSYLRRGDVVLIPVRAGVGLRLGVNAGYMKFSKRQNWFPF